MRHKIIHSSIKDCFQNRLNNRTHTKNMYKVCFSFPTSPTVCPHQYSISNSTYKGHTPINTDFYNNFTLNQLITFEDYELIFISIYMYLFHTHMLSNFFP